MKKEEKENFTKLTQKKGISLIVLIVTIMIRYDKWLKASITGKIYALMQYWLIERNKCIL